MWIDPLYVDGHERKRPGQRLDQTHGGIKVDPGRRLDALPAQGEGTMGHGCTLPA
jgi:hypothetical protein